MNMCASMLLCLVMTLAASLTAAGATTAAAANSAAVATGATTAAAAVGGTTAASNTGESKKKMEGQIELAFTNCSDAVAFVNNGTAGVVASVFSVLLAEVTVTSETKNCNVIIKYSV